MARRSPPRKVSYFEPVPPRLARNTVIESTFEVGRRFRCTMQINCGEPDPGAVIRPVMGEWHPHIPEGLDEEELADWRVSRNAVYQLASWVAPWGVRLAHALPRRWLEIAFGAFLLLVAVRFLASLV